MLFRVRFSAIIAGILVFFADDVRRVRAFAVESGVIEHTGRSTDLAILGPGYFELRDAAGRTYFTRWGSFMVDSEGYLVACSGGRVQGLQSDLSPGHIRIFFDPASSPVQTVTPDARMVGFKIEADGTVTGRLSEGTEFPLGRILLRTLRSPEAGLKFRFGLILDQGELGVSSQSAQPGLQGVGHVSEGALETPQPRITLRGRVGNVETSSEAIFAGSNVDTDLAICGRGYFTLRDPESNQRYATRAGAFYWDVDGFLVHYSGCRVQGFLSEIQQVDDIRVQWNGQNVTTSPDAVFVERTIDRDGTIRIRLSDGSEFNAAQILLRAATEPSALVKRPFAVYDLNPASSAWTDYKPPGANDFGFVIVGQLDVTQMDSHIVAARERMNFFQRGIYIFTGRQTDCYINGQNGFFTVRDPERNAFYATREGRFHLNAENYLVTSNGFRVQGLIVPTARGAQMEEVSGDIQINAPGQLPMVNFQIAADGRVRILLADGSELDRAQIRLQTYRDPHALVREGNYLYSNLANAWPAHGTAAAAPGTSGLGTLISGAVEDITLESGIQIPPPDAMRLIVQNLPVDAILETSVDLARWTELTWVGSAVFDAVEFFDAANTMGVNRFYRVRVPKRFEPISLPILFSNRD